jgi:uridine phosphorylase
MKRVYHLDLEKKDLKGAKIALLPGDPFRALTIAEEVSRAYGGGIKKLAWKREFCSYRVRARNPPL